jgi:threonine dehydratase
MTIQPNAETVTTADVLAAAQTIRPVAVRTPLLNFTVLDERIGGRIFLKPELLQRTGSFKFRGAYNKISSILADQRAAGVVAFSSGNHAQGVAAAAQLFGMPATIVMPADSPAIKQARTKGYGATVVLYDRDREDREAIARDLCAKAGATLVPPFDDPKIIAGQGTMGLEIADDLAALGLVPDIVAAGASGGGLVSGLGLGIRSRFADAQILTAEPEGFDDYALSLARGERVGNSPGGRTICDALMSPLPGEITFAVNQRLGTKGVVASEREVREAMKFVFSELKLVVEPGGAVALAALLAGRIDGKGKTVAIVLSGGNVDPALFAEIIG